MSELEKYIFALNNLPDEIREAEFEIEENDILVIKRQNNSDAGGEASSISEIFGRVYGEKSGSVYTQKLNELPEEILNRAFKNSLYSEQVDSLILNPGDGTVIKNIYDEKYFKTGDEIRDYIKKIEKAINKKCSGIINQYIEISRNVKKLSVVNSKNLRVVTANLSYEASVSISANHNGVITVDMETSAKSLEEIDVNKISDYIYRKISENIKSVNGSSRETEAVLDNSVVCNIFLTGWQFFSGKTYFNNESSMVTKLNYKISSDKISISDLCESGYTGYQFRYDCEGSKCKNVDIVKKGVFQSLLNNLSTASKALGETTGNGGRKPTISGVVQTETVVVPKNFTILPGNVSMEDMIAQMNDGVYINQSFDVFHSINIASGDFSIPCEGIIIKNGKRVGRMTGITLEGNILTLLNNITEVGSEIFTFTIPIIKSYAISAPALKISSIKISV